jgi:hypothetical protein
MFRAGSFAVFFVIHPLVLVGCPDGAGLRPPRQDGGDARGEEDDASTLPPEEGAVPTPEGGTSGGSGARCGANGRNDCGPFLLCAESLGCVECRADTDCPAAAGRCLAGICVGCRPGKGGADAGPPDCPGAASACWTSDHECHAPCGDANTCPAGTACDRTSGECAGCTTNADCPSGVCSPTLRKCVDCISDATCPSTRPRCRVLTGTCEACTANSDCGVAQPVCDPLTFTCRLGCTSDAHCPGKRCDGASAKCVEIVVDGGLADARDAN